MSEQPSVITPSHRYLLQYCTKCIDSVFRKGTHLQSYMDMDWIRTIQKFPVSFMISFAEHLSSLSQHNHFYLLALASWDNNDLLILQ